MSSRALESRASASSSGRSAESHPSASRNTTTSSTMSDQRPRRQKGSSAQFSGHSSDHSAASDSSPSQTSSSTQIVSANDQSRQKHSHQTHQNKSSSTSKQTSSRHLQEAHFLPNSTASSGFSSAMSDTSAHSTSGTSSPYASGVGGQGSSSVFSTQRLSPADIKYRDERPKVVRSFIIGKLIGEGSYGKVKEGIDSKTKKMVAIKILSKKTLRRVPGGEASIEREIGIIESLKHKHVVSIHSHFPVEAKQKFYIVCEYMGGGTLSSLLESAPGKKLPLHQARKLFSHLIAGLEHLREHRILHRDIKPDNLLLTSSGELKIGDFGVADVISSDPNVKTDERSGIGSPAFQAPELISSPNPSSSSSSSSSAKKSKRAASDLIFKSDIWSAGIILFIMVVGEYPFPIQGNIMLLFEDIAAGKYEVPDWVDPDCSDLIKQMLHTNPVERIDLVGIKAHAFVKNAVTKSAPSVATPPIHSMWPHHDKTSLASIVKKLKPQLERQEAQERAERRAFGDDDFDDDEEEGGDGKRRKHNGDHDNDLLDSASDDSDAQNTSSNHHSLRDRESHQRARDSRSSSSKCIVM